MSNKRIQKKRAKAATYQARIDFIAHVAGVLCPCGSRDELSRLGMALWKRDDVFVEDVLLYALARSSPIRTLFPRRQPDAPSFVFNQTRRG